MSDQRGAPVGTRRDSSPAPWGPIRIPSEGTNGITRLRTALGDIAARFSACGAAESGYGGIEPRTLDLQVLLRQALARVGQEGLASCLALFCSDQDLVHVVEAWPRLPASCKRLILDAVSAQ